MAIIQFVVKYDPKKRSLSLMSHSRTAATPLTIASDAATQPNKVCCLNHVSPHYDTDGRTQSLEAIIKYFNENEEKKKYVLDFYAISPSMQEIWFFNSNLLCNRELEKLLKLKLIERGWRDEIKEQCKGIFSV